MNIKHFQNALTPGNGYVCLTCRLRLPSITLQTRRQQHAGRTELSNSQLDILLAPLGNSSAKGNTQEDIEALGLDRSGKLKGAPSSPTEGHTVSQLPQPGMVLLATHC